MNIDDQWKIRVHLISIFIFIQVSLPCSSWHQTLTFPSRLSYNTTIVSSQFSHMKFFMWYQSYAIYGAREKLILLQPNFNTSSMQIFSYDWPIDSNTMDECLQEWNSKDKCYNDIVHVRILPNSTLMDVYCTYAHRPMVRTFDLQTLSFLNENLPQRDPHPPMDSERSYVMLTFNTSIITAGYQGDYIPTIRASQGRTLLYALRQNSYFIGGFKYDGKAVFGVIESSDRIETNRISRLVMTCANRAEVIRKATLNCSTDMFDRSRSFVFHILTDLIDPIRTIDGSVLLFASFTTNNSSLTASAVCLFLLDKQFYEVFTSSSLKTALSNDMSDLIVNCSQTIPSTLDRDIVESDKEFSPYLFNPLLLETMSNSIFTSINVLHYEFNRFCLIIGTSDGRLLTAFMNSTYQTQVYEELILSKHVKYSIQSITYERLPSNESYVIIITNQMGVFTVQLVSCSRKLCFQCWTNDCLIEKMNPKRETTSKHQCSFEKNIRLISMNNSILNMHNQTISSDNQSKTKLIFAILIPLSFVIFLLSILIIILLTRSTRKLKRARFYPTHSHETTYTNHILYRTSPQRKNQQHVFPIKSELCIRRISSNPVYSTVSSQSLPSLILSPSSNHSTQSYMSAF